MGKENNDMPLKVGVTVIILVLLLLLSWVFISGCSVYKKLDKHNPVTSADSLHLIKKCNQVFPYDTSGKIKLVFITKKDSSDFYQHLADSIKKIKQKVLHQIDSIYHDTCTSVKDKFQEGEELGYQMGFYQGKLFEENVYQDILKTNDSLYTVQVADIKRGFAGQIAQLNIEKNILSERLTKKSNSLNNWRVTALVSMLAFLLAVIIIILQTKKKRL